MLYSGFNILPRSVFWSASFNGRSDNTDVIPSSSTVTENPPPIRSIKELEDRNLTRNKKPRRQMGLGKLILTTNLLGVIVGVVVSTRGYAIPLAIAMGIAVGFLMPMIIFIYMSAGLIFERIFGRSPPPDDWRSKLNAKKNDPFSDL